MMVNNVLKIVCVAPPGLLADVQLFPPLNAVGSVIPPLSGLKLLVSTLKKDDSVEIVNSDGTKPKYQIAARDGYRARQQAQ